MNNKSKYDISRKKYIKDIENIYKNNNSKDDIIKKLVDYYKDNASKISPNVLLRRYNEINGGFEVRMMVSTSILAGIVATVSATFISKIKLSVVKDMIFSKIPMDKKMAGIAVIAAAILIFIVIAFLIFGLLGMMVSIKLETQDKWLIEIENERTILFSKIKKSNLNIIRTKKQ